MNIFKGLLFLEGHIVDARLLEDSFGPHYGNQRASERTFRDPFATPEFARPAANAQAACSAAGCG